MQEWIKMNKMRLILKCESFHQKNGHLLLDDACRDRKVNISISGLIVRGDRPLKFLFSHIFLKLHTL